MIREQARPKLSFSPAINYYGLPFPDNFTESLNGTTYNVLPASRENKKSVYYIKITNNGNAPLLNATMFIYVNPNTYTDPIILISELKLQAGGSCSSQGDYRLQCGVTNVPPNGGTVAVLFGMTTPTQPTPMTLRIHVEALTVDDSRFSPPDSFLNLLVTPVQ